MCGKSASDLSHTISILVCSDCCILFRAHFAQSLFAVSRFVRNLRRRWHFSVRRISEVVLQTRLPLCKGNFPSLVETLSTCYYSFSLEQIGHFCLFHQFHFVISGDRTITCRRLQPLSFSLSRWLSPSASLSSSGTSSQLEWVLRPHEVYGRFRYDSRLFDDTSRVSITRQRRQFCYSLFRADYIISV